MIFGIMGRMCFFYHHTFFIVGDMISFGMEWYNWSENVLFVKPLLVSKI